MKVLILFFNFYINENIRNIYWLFRLVQIKFNKGANYLFPLIKKGEGDFEFGINAQLRRMDNRSVPIKLLQKY